MTLSATGKGAAVSGVVRVNVVEEALATYEAQLHTGNPGAEGKNNVAAENTKKNFSLKYPAFSEGPALNAAAAIEWAEVKAKETYSWVSLWKAGVFILSGELTTPVAVEVGDTFKINKEKLTISAS